MTEVKRFAKPGECIKIINGKTRKRFDVCGHAWIVDEIGADGFAHVTGVTGKWIHPDDYVVIDVHKEIRDRLPEKGRDDGQA